MANACVRVMNRVIPASYQNRAQRIHISGLAPRLVPSSPEDIKIPVPASELPSGVISPVTGLGSPRTAGSGEQTPDVAGQGSGALPLRTPDSPENGHNDAANPSIAVADHHDATPPNQ